MTELTIIGAVVFVYMSDNLRTRHPGLPGERHSNRRAFAPGVNLPKTVLDPDWSEVESGRARVGVSRLTGSICPVGLLDVYQVLPRTYYRLSQSMIYGTLIPRFGHRDYR